MTPQRLREIAVLLIEDAQRRRELARQFRLCNDPVYRREADQCDVDGAARERAARELQEFSFEIKR